jgi:hypothetical protein
MSVYLFVYRLPQGSSLLPWKWLREFTQGGGEVTLVA